MGMRLSPLPSDTEPAIVLVSMATGDVTYVPDDVIRPPPVAMHTHHVSRALAALHSSGLAIRTAGCSVCVYALR